MLKKLLFYYVPMYIIIINNNYVPMVCMHLVLLKIIIYVLKIFYFSLKNQKLQMYLLLKKAFLIEFLKKQPVPT